MDVIQVQNISFSYSAQEQAAIKDLSFSLKKGEIMGVAGENGAGKSTLCQILVGLIPHYINGTLEGEVLLEGRPLRELAMGEISRKIGLVFQNPFNQLSYTASTVRDELAFGLGNFGVEREEMLRRVELAAQRMRIGDILDRNPLFLSGGQVQRVALGSCLIMNPEILVLDECCSQLDPLGSEEIYAIIRELRSEGMSIVLVEHDMERLAATADRILVLRDGTRAALGTPEEVFSDETLRDALDVPDYVRMGERLRTVTGAAGPLPVREGELVRAVKDAAGRCGQ